MHWNPRLSFYFLGNGGGDDAYAGLSLVGFMDPQQALNYMRAARVPVDPSDEAKVPYVKNGKRLRNGHEKISERMLAYGR